MVCLQPKYVWCVYSQSTYGVSTAKVRVMYFNKL